MQKRFEKCLILLLAAAFAASFAGCAAAVPDPLETPSPLPVSDAPLSAPPSPSAAPEPTAAPEGNAPRPDFYGMTMEESYEKYGIFTYMSFSMDSWYDEGKFFQLRYVSEEGGGSVYAPMTLKYRDYPGGETWSPVCSDPLCAHTGAAGCPLHKCNNPFCFVCMAGKVFFVGSDSVLYLFDRADNSLTALHDKLYEYKLYEQDGALYAVYQVEDADFNVRFAALKATPEGEVTELGSVGELWAVKDAPVYADKYLLDARFDAEEGKAVLCMREFDFESVRVVFETAPYAGENTDPWPGAQVLAIYGTKALFRMQYRADRQREDICLVDLVSGEGRLLASKPDTVQTWLFSDRCVIWSEERHFASDPFIVHVLFPFTGEEKTYDLSSAAAGAGGVIPASAGLSEVKNGALLVNCIYANANGMDEDGNTVYEMAFFDAFEYDLSSGRGFCYEAPDLPEYASLFE